jgi:hypothetical protein
VIGSGLPTAADAALTWTAMVLKELMRLYPSAPFLGRSALQADRIGRPRRSGRRPGGALALGHPSQPRVLGRARTVPHGALRARGRTGAAPLRLVTLRWRPAGVHRPDPVTVGGRHRACCAGVRLRLHSPPRPVAYTTEITLRPAGGLPGLVTPPARRPDSQPGLASWTRPAKRCAVRRGELLAPLPAEEGGQRGENEGERPADAMKTSHAVKLSSGLLGGG